MKKATIVYAHPWDGSFNKAILDSVAKGLEKSYNIRIINLYKENFSPIMEEKSLYLFSKGKSSDKMVEQYQNILLDTHKLIFIFPIWWLSPPAIIKGFIDKVMLKDFAYSQTKSGIQGKLNYIESATVVTTSEMPTWYINTIGGNPIKGVFIRNILKKLGIKKVKWHNCGRTVSGSQRKRQSYLKKVSKII